jgi:DnaK suppressor protein
MGVIDTEYFKTRLEALRAALAAERREGGAESGTVEADQSRLGRLSRLDALQAQAMSVAAQERRRIHMQQIDAALRRIEEGDYGYCLDCGEEIAPRRLEVDPASAFCLGCASKRES